MTCPPIRALPIVLAVFAGFLSCPSAVLAQSAPASTPAQPQPQPAPQKPPETLSLTDEQKMAVLNGNTEDSVDAARAGLGGNGSGGIGRSIHGEVGAMIGSNGTRGIYGVAAIPLGDNAGAVVSVESSRVGYPH